MLIVIIASTFLGFLVAIIGAWKDTQWEKFRWQAFFRSPLLCAFWGGLLAIVFPTESLILVVLSAAASERLTVELWKGTLRKMPSKFSNEHRDTQWVKQRMRKNNS